MLLVQDGKATEAEKVINLLNFKKFNFSEGYKASDLQNFEFKEPLWIIPGILPEGLTIIGGAPKARKSWLALNICMATSFGGNALGCIKVPQFDTLYLALEDTKNRIKRRFQDVLKNTKYPENLTIFHKWEKLEKGDIGGLNKLDCYLYNNPRTKLVIIDTFAKIKPMRVAKGGSTLYDIEYEILSSIKDLSDKHHIAIILIHHLRKGGSTDPLEELSGSMAIGGTVDSIWILKRPRGQNDGTLFMTGRDIDETILAMRWDNQISSWIIMGDAIEFNRSQEQKDILDILKTEKRPITLRQLSEIIGKKTDTIYRMLVKLSNDGLIVRNGDKYYSSDILPS